MRLSWSVSIVFLAATLTAIPAVIGPGAIARADCAPEFGLHMAALRADVGVAMGQPLDCEHATDAGGDTIQPTSTGTAWYTNDTSAAMFTDGYQRWQLDPKGLTYWGGPDASPLLLDGLPDGPAVWTRAVTCPVLYTHEVPSAAGFRTFLTGLIQAGFQPVSFAVVDASMRGESELPAGCLVLSFDDALASQLRNAAPVLSEFGITGLFFVMPTYQDGHHQYLGASGIRALHDAGQMIGAHTCNHPSLPLLSPSAMMAELSDCKHQVEDIIGVPVRYLAYPNGAANQAVVDATTLAGYRAAFTTRRSATLRPDQPLLEPRIRYDPSEAVSTVVRRIRAAR
ncbi:MAG TPA: polysaccharide deacetylase family protein [Chloroflexota bacterium]|nr:polysaccharide deacetylase family protein [Chloroflexota bacterium]